MLISLILTHCLSGNVESCTSDASPIITANDEGT